MKKKQKFGIDLAESVYNLLVKGIALDFSHYGYCGVGFVYEEGLLHYTHFDEWLTWRNGTQYKPGEEYIGIIKTFSSKTEFVEWLAVQTDETLSGIEANDDWYSNNQRVTRERLEWFVARFNCQ
ncbi:hypothetical protein [Enterovibrio baiacu]|uniref:hypothetical protein n=1 Tax=Enterovibrio baiacu TaxID=2491023 RepID=UPI003D0EDCBB